ncbi:hypothetical protein [Thiolinea disciformis]|uniref:hypothetical protein n=1 Tax=Thiolinea disciformis TaxID=125614 RepID=UPI00036D1FC0|nr:hypothetical protein [Thiolinea disciformis]
MQVRSYYKSFEPQTWSNTSYSVVPRSSLNYLHARQQTDTVVEQSLGSLSDFNSFGGLGALGGLRSLDSVGRLGSFGGLGSLGGLSSWGSLGSLDAFGGRGAWGGLGYGNYGRYGNLGSLGYGGYGRYGSTGYRPYIYDNYGAAGYRWPSNSLMRPLWQNLAYTSSLERGLGPKLPLSRSELGAVSDALADSRGLYGMPNPRVVDVFDTDLSRNVSAGDIARTSGTDGLCATGSSLRFVVLNQDVVDQAYDTLR